MPQLHAITPDKLFRLIGTPAAPRLVDLRSGPPEILIPSAVRRPAHALAQWAPSLVGTTVVTICEDGSRSQGAAAWLRSAGVEAEALEGGFAAWRAAGLPLLVEAHLPTRDAEGRTLWVTRARPKVDRIACPWLIRRFVDPDARFLFVPAGEVLRTAAQYQAAPFDIAAESVFWSHRGERCTFDVMVEELGLASITPLVHLAQIVRGADTARLEIAPEAAGLLAVSLGLSRIYADDNAQLDAGMLVYDALYRWCRDATGETHDWTSHQPRAARP